MNNIIIAGNLGGDAEERTSSNDTKYWTFNVATTESWKDKDGQRQSITTWHKCMLYGNYSGLAPYLQKGTSVVVQGVQKNDRYDFKDQKSGQEVQHNGKNIVMIMSYIKVREVQLMGNKGAQQESGNTQQAAPAAKPAATAGNEPMETDDLPF